MSDFGTTFPDSPYVLDEDVIDNDLLPYNHLLTAHSTLDVFAGVGTGVQQFHTDLWTFSVITYTTVQTTGEIGWYIATAAGTWDIQWILSKRNDYGISQARVDGVNVGPTVDLYAAATANYYMHRVNGVALTRGEHLFTLKQNGTKNASSSAYLQVVSGLSLVRTA